VSTRTTGCDGQAEKAEKEEQVRISGHDGLGD